MTKILNNNGKPINEDESELVKFLLQPSIIIAMITALLFLVTAAYKVGLYSYYKIPINLIKIDIKDVVPMIVVVIINIAIFCILVAVYSYLKKKHIINKVTIFLYKIITGLLAIMTVIAFCNSWGSENVILLFAIVLLCIGGTFKFLSYVLKEMDSFIKTVTFKKIKQNFDILVLFLTVFITVITFFHTYLGYSSSKLSVCKNSTDKDYNTYILVDSIDDKYIVVNANVVNEDTITIYRGVFTKIDAKDIMLYQRTFKNVDLI